MKRSLMGVSAAAVTLLAVRPAGAHYLFGSDVPASWAEGLLSGLAHPIVGLDHFAAVVAVGCLASVHRAGRMLTLGYLAAMIAGAWVQIAALPLAAVELLVALSVLGLGAAMLWRPVLGLRTALALFVATGMIHGTALGTSIAGAGAAPLCGYVGGLVLIQAVIALGALHMAHVLSAREGVTVSLGARLIGAAIIGVAVAALLMDIWPDV